MKRLLCFSALMFSGAIQAAMINGFTDTYSPFNWTTTSGITGNLTVGNTSAHSMNLEIANLSHTNPINTFLEIETVAAGTGVVSFDLILGLIFRPLGTYAPSLTFFTVKDGIGNIEATHNLDNSLFQHIDITVHTGQTFGFRLDARGLQQGVSVGATITSFSAPLSEPIPLFLVVLGSMIMLRLNRSNLPVKRLTNT